MHEDHDEWGSEDEEPQPDEEPVKDCPQMRLEKADKHPSKTLKKHANTETLGSRSLPLN